MTRVVSIIIPNTHKLWVKGISLSVYSRSYDFYSQEQDFTELGKLVHDFKYLRYLSDDQKQEIIDKCSEAIISKLQLTESNDKRSFNCIIAVPPNLNPQVSLPSEISHYLATKLPWLTDGSHSISKVKPLPSMKTISNVDKRSELLRGAYALDSDKLPKELMGFLIIDDVIQSGSTIREISRTLHRDFPDIPRYIVTLTHLKGIWSQPR